MTFALRQASVGFKKILPSVVFLTLLSFFALPLSHSEATSFTTGLVGHWKFDETSGTTAADSSGNSNNGTLTNGPTITTNYAPTIFSNTRALNFDATDDYVAVAHNAALTGMSAITVSGNVFLESIPGATGTTAVYLIRKGEWSGANRNIPYEIIIQGQTVFSVFGASDRTSVILESTTELSASQWYNISTTWDGTTARLYINGIEEDSAALVNGSLYSETTPLVFNSYYEGGTFYYKNLDGSLDDVRIYNRALSAEEISVLAAEKSLVGYWKFDETSGTSATDSSGMGNTGTLNGATISTDVPPTNFPNARSLSFDGSDDYVSAGATPFASNSAFTISTWVRPGVVNNNHMRIMDIANSGDGVWLGMDETTGNKFALSLYGGATTYTTSTTTAVAGQWYHVTATYDGTNGRLYVNGVLEDTDANTYNGGGTKHVIIGCPGTTNGSVGFLTDCWNGLMDDVRIYNRALSADEIDDLADGDHPGTTWTGEHSIYYEDPNNWNTGVVPDPYSNVTIANAGARPILTDDVSLSDLTINSNASLDLKDKDLTMLDGGTFLNDGSLILDGSQTMTDFQNESSFGGVIIRGSSNLTSFPTGMAYNDLRIEDPTESGLVGYWKMDEGSGSTTLDLSGNGNDGTLVNAPTWSTSVGSTNFHNPRSLSFDGINDYASVSGSYPTGTSSRSLCSWVKSADGIKNGNADHILNYGDIDTAEAFGIMIYTGNRYWFYGHGGAMDMDTGITADTSWHHHCVTYDGATVRYYIDGTSVASASRTLATADGNLRMAIRMDDTDDNNFDGSLDDVRIYNRTLSAKEVANLAKGRYAAGSSSTATHTPSTSIIVNGTLSLDSGNLNTGAGASITNALSLLRGGGNLTLGSALTTLNGGLTLSGATLTGGSGTFDINGALSVLTGSLIAPSGTMYVSGNYAKTGGYFTHNGGTVSFDGNFDQSLNTGGDAFSTATVEKTAGTLNLVTNDLSATTLNVTSGAFAPASLTVTTNAMTVNGGTFAGAAGTLDVNRSLALSSGTLTAPSGLLTLSGSFIRSGGTFTHNSGRVILDSPANTTLANTQAFNDLAINDGLVGYWNLDETSGTSAADSSGYENTGSHINGPTISTDVPDVNFTNARSLSFDGTDDYVTVSRQISDDFTLSAWVNKSASLTNNGACGSDLWYCGFGIIDGEVGGVVNDFGLSIKDNKAIFGVGNPDISILSGTLNSDQWYLLTATRNKTTGVIKLYVDGTEVASGTGNANSLTSPTNLGIGVSGFSSGRYFNGKIDDVRIYNRALSAAEVATLADGDLRSNDNAVTLGSALDVNGDFTLAAHTLNASGSNYGINVAGDWNNAGTFTAQQCTVTFDGTNQSLVGDTTFYNLTKSVASADSLTFGSGSTTTVTNTTTFNGAASNLLSLRSSADGFQWNIDPQGTRTLSYLDAKDSNNVNASAIMAGGLNIVNSGNLTNWVFDQTAPGVSSISPANGSTNASLTPTLILTLDEESTAVSAKHITIKKASDNSTVETIAASGALVTVSGAVVTIRPSVTLSSGTTYYVLVDEGSFKDDADNEFAGILATSAWSFTTVDTEDEGSSSSASGNAGGGGYRGTTGAGGRSDRAQIVRETFLRRFERQVASDEEVIPPIAGSSRSSRSSRPTIVDLPVTATGITVAEKRGHLEISTDGIALLYKDVPVDAWFAPYVSFLIEEEIAQGYKDEAGKPKGEFGVENPVTYAELAKMVLQASHKDLKTAAAPRNPAARGTWASPFISLAEDLHFSVFAPTLDIMKPATRGDVIRTILEAFAIPIGNQKAQFSDVPADHPHSPAIAVAVFYGFVDGDTDANGTPKGTFRPNDSVNRAEVAKIIALAIKLLAK